MSQKGKNIFSCQFKTPKSNHIKQTNVLISLERYMDQKVYQNKWFKTIDWQQIFGHYSQQRSNKMPQTQSIEKQSQKGKQFLLCNSPIHKKDQFDSFRTQKTQSISSQIKFNIKNEQKQYLQHQIIRKRKNYIDDDDLDNKFLKNIKKITIKNTSDIKNQNYKLYWQNQSIQKVQVVTCTICLDIIGQQKVELICSHKFCLSCVSDWFQKTSKCPLCRQAIQYYVYKNKRIPIQQKQYNLQNYLNNIDGGDLSDEIDQLDYYCQNCQHTQLGDQLFICDGCFVNSTHLECDRYLNGKRPPDHRDWFCSICRQSPSLWYVEKLKYHQ